MIRSSLISLLISLFILSLSSLAMAAASTGDITVQSAAGVVTTYGEGTDVTATSNVHSVDVKDGGSTGDITVQGIAGEVTTVGIGTNVNAESNVGSVKVGD